MGGVEDRVKEFLEARKNVGAILESPRAGRDLPLRVDSGSMCCAICCGALCDGNFAMIDGKFYCLKCREGK